MSLVKFYRGGKVSLESTGSFTGTGASDENAVFRGTPCQVRKRVQNA